MAAPAPDPSLRPLTGGAVMTAAGRVIVAVTGAATTILVARLLGPAGTGAYAIAVSIVLALTVLATAGVEHGIAYYVGNRTWAVRDALRTAQRVALVAGSAAAVLGVGVRLLAPDAFAALEVWMCVVVVAGLPFALSWLFSGHVALADDRYEDFAALPAVQSAAALVLVGGLGAVFGLDGALAGLTASHIVAAAFGLRRARAVPPRASVEPPRDGQLRRAVAFGAKGYAANALQLVNLRLDLFILSSVASAAAVGHLSVAIAATSVVLLLPPALSDVLFPRVAALAAGSTDASRAHLELVETKGVRHTTIVVVVACVVVAAALLVLVVPVYGTGFRPSVTLGLILLPGIALLGIAGVLSATIVGRGRPGLSLITALVVTPITVALYVVLIPRMEAEGAALASTLSYAGNFALTAFFYRRVTGRRASAVMVPTASELDDLRALPAAIRAWAGGRRRPEPPPSGC